MSAGGTRARRIATVVLIGMVAAGLITARFRGPNRWARGGPWPMMNPVLVLGGYAVYRAVVQGEFAWVLIGVSTAAAFVVAGLGWFGERVMGDWSRSGSSANWS